MNPKLNFILLLAILFAGCTQPEKKDILEISPEYFIDQKITLSDIAEDIEYIPLNSKKFFSFILSPQITDSLIIFNGGQGSGIFEYSRDGSFIREIGRNGRGPGEYQYGVDITLDDKNQRIYIYEQGKFLVYDFKGKLVRDIKISTNSDFSEIEYHNSKLYLFAALTNNKYFNPPYNWIILDTLGNEISTKKNSISGFPESKSTIGIYSNDMYKFNDKIYYWNYFNDTIFELQDTAYKAAYLFKNDEYRLIPEISGNAENFIGKNKYYVVISLFESQHYLFINYRQYNKSHLCIYNKQEEIFRNYTIPEGEEVVLINDIDGGLPFPLEEMIELENREYLVASINPIELKEYIASDEFKNSTPKFPEKKKELEQLANSLDENDNPVLMLVKLKE